MRALRALTALAANPKIASPPLRVLLFVWPELDTVDFRTIKQRWVATHLEISQQNVSAILGTLVREGFLELGPTDGTAKTYRINGRHEAVREIYSDWALAE